MSTGRLALVVVTIMLALGCGTEDGTSDRGADDEASNQSAPRSLSCTAGVAGITDYLPGAKGAERPEDLMSRRGSADTKIEIVKSEREAVGYVTLRSETVEIVKMELTDGGWLETSSDRCATPE